MWPNYSNSKPLNNKHTHIYIHISTLNTIYVIIGGKKKAK